MPDDPLPDYYKILQVHPEVDQQRIEKMYRWLAQEYHPDHSKDPQAGQRMKEINAAYEVLKDPEKRKEYNAKRDLEEMQKKFRQGMRQETVHETIIKETVIIVEKAPRTQPADITWKAPPQPAPKVQQAGVSGKALLIIILVLAVLTAAVGIPVVLQNLPPNPSPNKTLLYEETGADGWKGWKSSLPADETPLWFVNQSNGTLDASNTGTGDMWAPFAASGVVDFAIETKVEPLDSFGVFFHAVNSASDHGESVIVDSGVCTIDNIFGQTIAQGSIPANGQGIRIEIIGTNVRVFVDGKFITKGVIDGQGAENGDHMGLIATGSPIQVDYFRVYEI